MERLDFEQCLKDILEGKLSRSTPRYHYSRLLSHRNSCKIAALCTPDLVAGLQWTEKDHFLQWIGSLAEPQVGRDLLRKILATPEMLPHDVLSRLIAAPITQPRLLFDGSRHNPACKPPADLANSANPADAILNHAGAVLRGFQTSIWGIEADSFHIDNGEEVHRRMRFKHPETAKLVEADSVDVLRMLADIRLEPMPVALMLHLGGPKCRRLLLRPETYEGSGLSLGSLATYALMALYTDEAVLLLNDMEIENPGFLRTVKDAAGHNLLWYLGFKEHIFIHDSSRTGESVQAKSRFNRYSLRDLLFKAKCDKNERDVFGVSWMDARGILKV
jgi:hypothetical protein